MKHKIGGRDVSTDPNDYPWDHPGMVVCPGRWVYGMASMALRHASSMRKSDFTGMVWRYDRADELGEWYFTGRMRYYADTNNDPWDGRDRTRWTVARFADMTAREARCRADEFLAGLALRLIAAGVLSLPPDWFIIEGGCEVWFEKMKTGPSWMHSRSYTDDGTGGRKIETRGWQPPSQ